MHNATAITTGSAEGKSSMSRSLCRNYGLNTRNAHVKYESAIHTVLKVKTNIKVVVPDIKMNEIQCLALLRDPLTKKKKSFFKCSMLYFLIHDIRTVKKIPILICYLLVLKIHKIIFLGGKLLKHNLILIPILRNVNSLQQSNTFKFYILMTDMTHEDKV